MKENNTSRNNGSALLVKQIRNTLEDLGRLTDDAAKSETIKNYLEFCARFHNYSWSNQILILLQCPDATHVAGFRTWQSMGRSIRKGSSAIRILAPMMYKRKKENKKENGDIIEDMQEKEVVRFFRPVCVFDVSQTMGDKPLPGPDIRITGDTHKELLQPLLDYIKKQGITTVFREINGGALGYTTRNKPIIVVDNTLSPDQQIETLLHETAHQLLHQNNNGGIYLSREEEELEASAVAYVVCQHHGLITKNPNYLALWDADSKKIRNHMERITGAARKIIQGIETNT
ncbi:MAG: ImmA/IrrE family metallo-endopeptidase [Thermoplasmatales archaeon]|nr:ImmA/IrrE family metallo-endopeptidase [Thermoplasmatales archaeon]